MSDAPARFHVPAHYAPKGPYRLLPARFIRLDDHRYVLTNEVGEHLVVDDDELRDYVHRTLAPDTEVYRRLKARHFLFDDESLVALDLLALKYRTRADRLADFTALHIFVVTLRCDHTCAYCQVSRQTEDRRRFDMSVEHADKALEMVFRSPSPRIKIEFQGGEPLLNFDLIRHIVVAATRINGDARRDLEFVIASNLTHLTDDILGFCRDHRICFSTSLDGPEDLHNARRALPGGNSFQAASTGIHRVREALGPDAIAALMTTSPDSLGRAVDIVDEYVRQGFHSIFLRSLSPYGFAVKTSLVRRYTVDDWIRFYTDGLAYVIDVNRRGYAMREELATILLQKLWSPTGTGYVDLQSPAGLAIAGIVYNYDGSIHASDEGRMLAEMGDATFQLGHLDTHTFDDVMTGEPLVDMLKGTMLEGVPMCSDCGFLPYCGADPAFHRATQGDLIGHKALSTFCTKQMAVLRHLISLLEDEPDAADILQRWAS